MAAPGRADDFDLNRTTLREAMEEQPFRFAFFQAVRLLQQIEPDREMVGEFVNPANEIVRFSASTPVHFPASQLQSLEWKTESRPPTMTVNFMGLTGPSGVLPLAYSELVIDRLRARDHTLREFLDIFNHRMLSLFYRAWEKYRFPLQFERGERDQMAQMLLDFIGLGTRGLQNRQAVSDESLIYYAGLLSQRPRSSVGLQQVLSEYFEVPVEIDQFAGRWYRLTEANQTSFRETQSYSDMLGWGAIVGNEVWDQQAGICVRIGPLSLHRYEEFLPGGSAHSALRALLKYYVNDELECDVQLVLERKETPMCQLGEESEAGPRLGWVSWLKTRAMNRDPRDTILRMER